MLLKYNNYPPPTVTAWTHGITTLCPLWRRLRNPDPPKNQPRYYNNNTVSRVVLSGAGYEKPLPTQNQPRYYYNNTVYMVVLSEDGEVIQ